jgi:hypothetical protein
MLDLSLNVWGDLGVIGDKKDNPLISRVVDRQRHDPHAGCTTVRTAQEIDLALQKAVAQIRLSTQIQQLPKFNLDWLLALRAGNGFSAGGRHFGGSL